MLMKWKDSAKTGEGIYILQSMIVYRKVVLKEVLNRIVNLPDSGYLPDTRYPAEYPVDPDIRYSPNNKSMCRYLYQICTASSKRLKVQSLRLTVMP